MVKKTTSLTIDSDILKEAKRRGMNISQFFEEGLRRHLNTYKDKQKDLDDIMKEILEEYE